MTNYTLVYLNINAISFLVKRFRCYFFFLPFFPEITDVKNYVSNKNRLFFSSFGN